MGREIAPSASRSRIAPVACTRSSSRSSTPGRRAAARRPSASTAVAVVVVHGDLFGVDRAADEGGQVEQRVAAGLRRRHHLPELAHDRLGRAGPRVDELELLLEVGAGHRHPLLAGALGQQQRAVGAVEQLVGGQRLAPLGHADRAAHGRRRPPIRVGDDAAAAALVGAGEQHDELVAAVARDDVVIAQLGAQRVGDRPQLLVAGLVAALVVDGLEVVEVDQQAGERRAGAAGAEISSRGAQVQRAVVDQAGERVGGSAATRTRW